MKRYAGKEKVFMKTGYYDETYIEFHVDYHPSFSEMTNLHIFGGNLSVVNPRMKDHSQYLDKTNAFFTTKQFAFCNK